MNHWTPADAAELDVLVWGLADAYFEHREQCEACRAASSRALHLRHHGNAIRPDPCPEYETWKAHKDDCRA